MPRLHDTQGFGNVPPVEISFAQDVDHVQGDGGKSDEEVADDDLGGELH